jgi:hypothetical protein
VDQQEQAGRHGPKLGAGSNPGFASFMPPRGTGTRGPREMG